MKDRFYVFVGELIDLYDEVVEVALEAPDALKPALLNVASGIEQLRQATRTQRHLER